MIFGYGCQMYRIQVYMKTQHPVVNMAYRIIDWLKNPNIWGVTGPKIAKFFNLLWSSKTADKTPNTDNSDNTNKTPNIPGNIAEKQDRSETTDKITKDFSKKEVTVLFLFKFSIPFRIENLWKFGKLQKQTGSKINEKTNDIPK